MRLFELGSFAFPPFPIGCWERGVSGVENIRKFGWNSPKYGGFQGGVAKFRRPVTFRGVPHRPFIWSVVSYFPLPNWVLGWGFPAPEILGNLGRIRQNMADSRAVWPSLGVPSRSVAFRVVPGSVFLRTVVSHFPQLGVGKGVFRRQKY